MTAFLDDWLVSQRSRLKETTWASYEVPVARIKQGIGQSKLQALTPLEVETFYARLADAA